DIITKVKNLILGEEIEIIEGAPDAYDKVKALDDKTLKQAFLGKNPLEVPREAQEELYQRFVQPHAKFNCKHCHGRGHTGWHDELHQLQPCLCLQRVIRTEVGKENKGLYDPSGNLISFSN
ncbi:MAG: hypothetical protein GWN00_04055, partial [Aliifodinibius sp.]|nr:hypothetical protein [Fodinibius sp.]NIY24008.1 hypothetical protein [Fodinibius sp.]